MRKQATHSATTHLAIVDNMLFGSTQNNQPDDFEMVGKFSYIFHM